MDIKTNPEFKKVLNLCKKGNFLDAAFLLKNLSCKYPADIDVLILTGHVHWKIEEYENSLHYYESARRLEPNSELASLGVFHSLWDMENHFEAIMEIARFMRISYSQDYVDIMNEINTVARDMNNTDWEYWKDLLHHLTTGRETYPCGTVHVSAEDSTAPDRKTPVELWELEQSAALGDPVAQYGLTLYIMDSKRARRLLRRAALSGYPPAAVTYADNLMLKDKKSKERARDILTPVAKQGYYPAIMRLCDCIDQGKCGPESRKDALTWVIFARLLREEKSFDRKRLYLYDVAYESFDDDIDTMKETEKRLRKISNADEIKSAEHGARDLVMNVPDQISWKTGN